MDLHLPPELELRLASFAIRMGRQPSKIASEAIERMILGGDEVTVEEPSRRTADQGVPGSKADFSRFYGIWDGRDDIDDGLTFQNRIRAEWDR